jgi:hypothetical protein
MLIDLLAIIVYYAWVVATIIALPFGVFLIVVCPIMKIWYVIKGEDDCYYEED